MGKHWYLAKKRQSQTEKKCNGGRHATGITVGLFLFLAVASFHLIVTLLGGVLGGLIQGIIVQIQSVLKGS
jgi:hypothetical protein